ncbi:MAG: hypothetical protein ACRD41_11275, partial [Candidatus Acidiferrales bacterium]
MISVHGDHHARKVNSRNRLTLLVFCGALACALAQFPARGFAARLDSFADVSAPAPHRQNPQAQSSTPQKSAEPASAEQAAPAANPGIEVTRAHPFGVALMQRQLFEP